MDEQKIQIDIAALSSKYSVRRLAADDLERVYVLSLANPLFFQYCPPFVTRESILEDMRALPPGMTSDDKYYVGFFRSGKLIAVMDLVTNYPDTQTAFIGLFMMEKSEQGRGIGSGIIGECARYFKSAGFRYIRLGFAKGDPQSEAFWRKNGFEPVGIEADNGTYTVVVMRRVL